MCGRASLTASPDEIAEAFDLTQVPRVLPRYNIAPSEPILAVRAHAEGQEAVLLRWGLIRPGSEDAKAPINLRIESATKGALKGTIRERRCIMPLTGFYEWRRAGKARQPFNVKRRDGAVFGVAGLWDRLEGGEGDPLESGLVLTTAANGIVKPIHDRMPVILDPSSYGAWLDTSRREPNELLPTLKFLSEDLLESYPVSPLVNRAGVEDPRCLAPVKPLSLW